MHIAIADDHPIFRSGLKILLSDAFPSAQVVEFKQGEEILEYTLLRKPDLIILDIDMPGMNGLDVCASISKECDTRIVILSMYKDREMIKKAFINGAMGYLVKDNTSEELVECVNEVLLGKTYLAREVRGYTDEVRKAEKEKDKLEEELATLTQAELKTLKLVSQKYSSKQIADLLFISVKSVENYRSRICKKLNLDARNNSLLLWVMENKSVLEKLEEF